MPLTNAIFESLPYIDSEPTPAQRAAALSLITSELDPQASTAPESHPFLPAIQPSNLSPAMQQEMTRLEADPTSKLRGIDRARYEALEAPSSQEETEWRAALHQAYTSSTYLSARSTSLSLLDTYGKNAWLISNSQLEDLLRAQERALAERKAEIDHVVIERKNAQEAVGAEITGLEENWRRGVGRTLETEVAAEAVRREILERRRAGAV